jgi:hypothetical protein
MNPCLATLCHFFSDFFASEADQRGIILMGSNNIVFPMSMFLQVTSANSKSNVPGDV